MKTRSYYIIALLFLLLYIINSYIQDSFVNNGDWYYIINKLYKLIINCILTGEKINIATVHLILSCFYINVRFIQFNKCKVIIKVVYVFQYFDILSI